VAVIVSTPALEGFYDRLQIVISQHATTARVALGGEWDLATEKAARAAIDAALASCPERVVLDLSRLTFIDSGGLHAAVELHERAARQNVQLEIIPGPPAVQRPFEICRLTDVLPFTAPA
jgi:stage II sporulation protein AA (anti-sigma F factor antagonist)